MKRAPGEKKENTTLIFVSLHLASGRFQGLLKILVKILR